MLDGNGNLLTSEKAIKDKALQVYSDRLEANKIEDNLVNHEEVINELCETRMRLCRLNKTEPWDKEDLKVVLKQLQNEKSRDAEGLANELFKDNAAGTDLLEAVLKLMNLMKEKQIFPKILQKCNITSIHNKKSPNKTSQITEVFSESQF